VNYTLYGKSNKTIIQDHLRNHTEEVQLNHFIEFTSLSSGKLRIYTYYYTSFGFAICPQNNNGNSLPINWRIYRSFGTVSPNSETLQLLTPDDTQYFIYELK
jgi:hypothetical protein